MLLKALGVIMMLDGVMSAASTLPLVDTFVYRSFRDQSLVVAHFLIGALLLLSGRLLFAREKRDRDSFSKNESRSLFPAATLVAALVMAGLEVTRFDWLAFVLRCLYTAGALIVVLKARK